MSEEESFYNYISNTSDPETDFFNPTIIDYEESESRISEHMPEFDQDRDDSTIDDTLRENVATQLYKDNHPDHDQALVGGREIAQNEAIWSVSTHKPQYGIDKLRDNNPLTYWQSNCSDPKKYHTVDISFFKATPIQQVSIFIDYFQDESYTPKAVSIRIGNTYRDLFEIMAFECGQIVGWINADLTTKNDGAPIPIFKLQVAISSTHLNGKDIHLRQLKVYSVLPAYLKRVEESSQGTREKKAIYTKGLR
ncbi:anaphase-promoting complex, subunit 10-domain-containing protein [Pilobolus umbonatus]|nr:anaphase-promoting complex, subunit 10-domain-containing protein [Pilobolus umbonatus]